MDNTQKQDLQKRVETVLESVRPYLQADGGDIKFLELTDDLIVKVNLSGACRTCMVRVQTLKGVENAIKSSIPEIKGIEDVI